MRYPLIRGELHRIVQGGEHDRVVGLAGPIRDLLARGVGNAEEQVAKFAGDGLGLVVEFLFACAQRLTLGLQLASRLLMSLAE